MPRLYQTYVRCQVNLHAEEFTRLAPRATGRVSHTLFTVLPSSVPRFRTVDLPERYNVGADLLERNLRAGRAAKVAIHSATGDLTYGDLAKLTHGAARALLDLGVRREERVLIVGFDSPGWVASFLGAIHIGAIPVPVNPLLQRSEDYDHFVEDSLARVVVVDANSEDKIKPAADRTSHQPKLLRADQLTPGDAVIPAATRRD